MRVYLAVFGIILLGLFGTFCYLMTTVHPKDLKVTTTPATCTITETLEVSTTEVAIEEYEEAEADKVDETEEDAKEEEEVAEIEEPEIPVNLRAAEVNATTVPAKKAEPENETSPVTVESPVPVSPQSRRSNFVVRFTDKNHKVVKQQTIALKTRIPINITTTTTNSTISPTPPSVKGFRRSAEDEPENVSKIVILKLLPNNTFIFEEDI